jgi:hypothetical protein
VFLPTVSSSSEVGGLSWRRCEGLSASVNAAEETEVRRVDAEGADESDSCVEVVEMDVSDAPGLRVLLLLLLLFVAVAPLDPRLAEDCAEEAERSVCERSSLDASAEVAPVPFCCLPRSMSTSPARVRSYSSRDIPAASARSIAVCWADSVESWLSEAAMLSFRRDVRSPNDDASWRFAPADIGLLLLFPDVEGDEDE